MSLINGVHKTERVMMTNTAKNSSLRNIHRLLNTACKTDKSFLQTAQSNLKPTNLLNKAFWIVIVYFFIPYIIF